MGQLLANYRARLDTWRLEAFQGARLNESRGDLSPKFHPSGAIKPFYGLTVVAFIDPESLLYQRLCVFQNRIRTALESARLESIFSFLNPLSFHMTLCDIMATSAPIPVRQVESTLQAARKTFLKLEKYPDLSCHLSGIGMDQSLLVPARFKTQAALQACVDIEQSFKDGLGVNERSFLGHISLAYFVQAPGRKLQRIKQTLTPFSKESCGLFPIRSVSLCYFRDMNSYTPLLSLDLLSGNFKDNTSFIDLGTL